MRLSGIVRGAFRMGAEGIGLMASGGESPVESCKGWSEVPEYAMKIPGDEDKYICMMQGSCPLKEGGREDSGFGHGYCTFYQYHRPEDNNPKNAS